MEALIPALIEAGIDCLQPLEVKAGMDLLKLKQRFGDQIALIGGMDERILETNDRQAVEAELLSNCPGRWRAAATSCKWITAYRLWWNTKLTSSLSREAWRSEPTGNERGAAALR